jgi:hypothetical protein
MANFLQQALILNLLIFLLSTWYVIKGGNEALKGVLGWFFVIPGCATAYYFAVMFLIIYVVPLVF